MYLLYEHLKDANGNLLATDMLMSSFYPGKPGINFKNPGEAGFFEFTKKTFKNIHISQRSYDPDTKIWSFLGRIGGTVYKVLHDSPLASVGLKFQRIESLRDQVLAGYVHAPTAQFAFDPQDFFYTPAPPVSTAPSKSEAARLLAPILGIPESSIGSLEFKELKKYYRAAAMLAHPDRNGGDGARMTNLNYLWQILQETKA